MANFEDDLKKLETLSNDIRRNDISIEDALKDFEEGIKLAKRLEKELENMEAKIQILMKDPGETDVEKEDEKEEGATEIKRTRKSSKKETIELELFSESSDITGTRNC